MNARPGLNFYSDTQTRPSRAMLAAALEAETGDEQRGTDPTTARLCERVAALLGQEAAVLLPSGTMCNEIALAVHGRPGDEVICDRVSHIVTSEAGGPAALSGLMVHMLDGDRGRFTADQVARAIRSGSRYEPRAASSRSSRASTSAAARSGRSGSCARCWPSPARTASRRTWTAPG